MFLTSDSLFYCLLCSWCCSWLCCFNAHQINKDVSLTGNTFHIHVSHFYNWFSLIQSTLFCFFLFFFIWCIFRHANAKWRASCLAAEWKKLATWEHACGCTAAKLISIIHTIQYNRTHVYLLINLAINSFYCQNLWVSKHHAGSSKQVLIIWMMC